MNVDELDRFLTLMCVQGGSNEPVRIECNYCSQDDYIFTDHAYSTDFHDVARKLFKHATTYHPEMVKEPIEPVTDEEIAEVFGLSRRTTKTKR